MLLFTCSTHTRHQNFGCITYSGRDSPRYCDLQHKKRGSVVAIMRLIPSKILQLLLNGKGKAPLVCIPLFWG